LDRLPIYGVIRINGEQEALKTVQGKANRDVKNTLRFRSRFTSHCVICLLFTVYCLL